MFWNRRRFQIEIGLCSRTEGNFRLKSLYVPEHRTLFERKIAPFPGISTPNFAFSPPFQNTPKSHLDRALDCGKRNTFKSVARKGFRRGQRMKLACGMLHP